MNICPRNSKGLPIQEIKYFKGSVKGEYSLVDTCLGAFKFVCVTHSEGMEGLGAVGILGLKGETGKKTLKTLI